ncbi:MAG TPA: YtxH domain-containing protein [Bacteroidales bacterium]|nr:YtxH domain-containing protein [Bacteroidales bacterium]HPS63886.1 YtxH domain-containing protein [Bacteroidales bacterium]
MSKSGSKVLLATLVGVAAGIGIGMLIAPAKGSKTRKRLKKRIMGIADFLQDDLSEKINAFKSAMQPEEREEDEFAEELKDEKGAL